MLHRQKIHACTVPEKNISKCMKRLYHPLPLPPQKSDVPPLGDLAEMPFVASPSLMTLFLFYWPTRYVGDDCQSLLRTRECLFTIFVLFHVRHHKMQHFATTCMKYIIMKGLKDKACGSKRITSICIPSSETRKVPYLTLPRVLRMHSTDWKSSYSNSPFSP